MENNCFVKSYLVDSNNENLLKFGEIKLQINTIGWDNESYRTFRFDGDTNNVYLELSGTLQFKDGTTSKVIIPESSKSVILAVGGKGQMSILSKYNLKEFSMPAVVLSGGVYTSIVKGGTGIDYMGNLTSIRSSIPITVDALKDSVKLKSTGKSSIIGDIAQLPDTTIFVWGDNNSQTTWESTRPASAEILAMICNLGVYVDDMLINQANCAHTAERSGAQLNIEVTGTRTSASDAAVAILKGYGFTIIVNGETL